MTREEVIVPRNTPRGPKERLIWVPRGIEGEGVEGGVSTGPSTGPATGGDDDSPDIIDGWMGDGGINTTFTNEQRDTEEGYLMAGGKDGQ